MTKNENVGSGWFKASIVLGVIAVIIALLPLLSAWLMFLTFVNYLVVPIGVICGVVAIVQSQNLAKSIIGIILCVLGLLLPFVLAERYIVSSIESVGSVLEQSAKKTSGLFEDFENTLEDIEDLDDSDEETDDDFDKELEDAEKALDAASGMLKAMEGLFN